MKTKNRVLILAAGALIGFSSCKKYLDINQNPNQSTTSTAALQLPTAQLYIGQAIGDRLYEIASVWSQYYTGGPGVSLGDWDKNTMSTTDANQVWNNLYRANSNFDYIIKKTNEPYYAAVSNILMGYNMQLIADLFGDAPFTDALKGDISEGLVVSPTYNSAKDVIYPGIEARVKEGLRLLDTVNASLAQPGANDLIYPNDGDLEHWKDQWREFANSLLLKLYVRSGNGAKVTELYNSANDLFITANEDIAKIDYPGDAKGKNPFWTDAKSTSLGNYFVASKTTVDYLKVTADPRIDYFFDANGAGAHLGLKQGDVENSPSTADYSRPAGAKDADGGLIFSPTAPVILISSWEVNLLLAEAAARGWIAEDPATLYNAAVEASGDYLGVPAADISDYLAGAGAYDPANPLRSIALQKWASMNGLQPVEAWIETRRFDSSGTPLFNSTGGLFQVPTNNVLGGTNFPTILFYPATEQDLNKNFPGQHTLTDRVFWDL
jgi:hypothetical protein